MTVRTLALAFLLPMAALAQLQLSQFDGVTEHPITTAYDLGKVSPADIVDTRFHVRNTGPAAVIISAVSVSGTAFSLKSAPSLGSTLAPGAFVELRVTFAPATAGAYSATLIVNTLSVTLRGAALEQLQLSQFDGVTEHAVTSVYDVGSVSVSGVVDTRFRVRNTGLKPVPITALSVTGTAFSLAGAPSLGTLLAPGAFAEFRVTFAPAAAGAYSTTLVVNTISVTLRGTAVQLQLSQFDGVTEHQVAGVYDLGKVSAGDAVDTRFRVRNTGPAAVLITALSVTGTAFSFAAAPSLGTTLAPGAFVEFRVTFAPAAAGAYSATLIVNTISVILRGAAVQLALVSVESSAAPLASGATVDFGNVEKGSSRMLNFTLSNPSATAINVASVAVTGTGFRGPINASAPLRLAAGQSVPFQIAFEPQTPQPSQGTLSVDQRSFHLTGHGFDPPLPAASIAFDSATLTSARQAKVSIPLAAPSKVSGTGTLTLQFQSGVAGVTDDPAVQFISGPHRIATVSVNVGDTVAHFGTQPDMTFQTGTTAGTLVFALQLPGETNQASMVVTPTAVSLDSSSGVRRASDVDVSLTGFDNTRSISTLAFTFFDRAGHTIQPGVLRVDASADFQRYFQTGTVGGMFALRATFPVSGDATQVTGVEVEIANSAGVTRTQRLTF
jgi:hypothetical protein